MTDQLDLFGTLPAPAPEPAPQAEDLDLSPILAAAASPHPYPWPHAHMRRPDPTEAFASASSESLAALADIALLDELPPIVPGALPRVSVDREGWHRAMLHRQHLVLRLMARTLTPGDAEALAALNYVNVQQVDWQPEGPMIITAAGYEHVANALAGLRCAAMEDADG
jgi:hypothetical protein